MVSDNMKTHTAHEDPTRRTHPFHGSIQRVDITASQTSHKYKNKIYTKTHSKIKQEIQTKMTARQNTYNVSHNRPKQTRPKLFDPQHRDQSNKHKRHNKFNRQHPASISFKSTSRLFPRAPSKNDEVKKGTRGGILNKSTNQNVLVQTKEKPRQKDFPNQSGFSQHSASNV